MRHNSLRDDVRAGCDGAITLEELGERIVTATFPPEWAEMLAPLLERETRPLVVRSSSIMEDDPDHSFAGIYLSDFLPNSGPLDVRLDQLTAAIKRVYASTFAPNARAYRKRHGLDWQRESMAETMVHLLSGKLSLCVFVVFGGRPFALSRRVLCFVASYGKIISTYFFEFHQFS